MCPYMYLIYLVSRAATKFALRLFASLFHYVFILAYVQNLGRKISIRN